MQTLSENPWYSNHSVLKTEITIQMYLSKYHDAVKMAFPPRFAT